MSNNAETSGNYYSKEFESETLAFRIDQHDKDLLFRIPDLVSLTAYMFSGNFSILDIGCGVGKVPSAIKHLYSRSKICGIDISQPNIEKARVLVPDVEFSQSNEMLEAFELNSFDYATCRMSFHHYSNIRKHLAAVRRILKPFGQYLIMDIIPENKEDCGIFNDVFLSGERSGNGDGHYRFYSKDEYREIAEENKYDVRFQGYSPLWVTWPKDGNYFRVISESLLQTPIEFRDKIFFKNDQNSFQFLMLLGGAILRRLD